MEAIQSATVVAARAMGMEKEAGTIEPGKRADVIVLDGNPLENISDIRKVSTVFAGGRMYQPAALWTSVGFKP
jgi:imidazolonepropionase-like amidohydrolase